MVAFETESGETTPVIELLSNTNVTVCGSATVVGLCQITLSPTLISTFWGVNKVNGADPFPPPAATALIVAAVLGCYCCCSNCSCACTLLVVFENNNNNDDAPLL